MDIKFFIGPMSKNVVDSIINFQNKYSKKIALIPSRRQIDFKGGYSNNWTTESLSKYAKKIVIMRDHGGPGQGSKEDNGYESLEYDCNYFDFIYIDGSHNGEDILSDAIEAFKILKKDGLIFFDDFLQYDKSRDLQSYEGIEKFLTLYSNFLKIEYFQNNLVVRKR